MERIFSKWFLILSFVFSFNALAQNNVSLVVLEDMQADLLLLRASFLNEPIDMDNYVAATKNRSADVDFANAFAVKREAERLLPFASKRQAEIRGATFVAIKSFALPQMEPYDFKTKSFRINLTIGGAGGTMIRFPNKTIGLGFEAEPHTVNVVQEDPKVAEWIERNRLQYANHVGDGKIQTLDVYRLKSFKRLSTTTVEQIVVDRVAFLTFGHNGDYLIGATWNSVKDQERQFINNIGYMSHPGRS